MIDQNIPKLNVPRIAIIGGGFAGIAIAKRLINKEVQVILVDKHNYHTFQPLLYQVATGGLEPDSIAYPLRRLFRKSKNVYFRMAKVHEITPDKNKVETNIGDLEYDYLVLATGSTSRYYNLESKKNELMALKSVPDALNLRSLILQNFEQAHLTKNLSEVESLINIGIVGGGATGVELAGALAEMKRYVLPNDYPELDFRKMQIHLFQSSNCVLKGMSDQASQKALDYLKGLGVNVWLNTRVTDYDDSTIYYNDGKDKFHADTIIWTAGVKGVVVEGLGEKAETGGRYKVNKYNQVEGHENIFAVGDVAAMIDEELPYGHPMLAPVAVAQGKLLGKNLLQLIHQKPMKEFKYHDKGTMATIGRNRAVVDLPNFKFQGVFAWFVWMFVHVFSLIGFRNRLVVLLSWIHNYFTYDRALRLIIRPFKRVESKQKEEV